MHWDELNCFNLLYLLQRPTELEYFNITSSVCPLSVEFWLVMANSVRYTPKYEGWSGGAKVLCKLSVPGRPTMLDHSRARAYCACNRCRWGMFGHFFSRLSFLFSFSLSGRRPDID